MEDAKLEGHVLGPILFGIGVAGALGKAGLLLAPKEAAEVAKHAAETTGLLCAPCRVLKRLGCCVRPVEETKELVLASRGWGPRLRLTPMGWANRPF